MVVAYSTPAATQKIRVISIEQLISFTESLKRNPITLALDLETTGLNARQHKIATMQFGTLKSKYVLDLRRYYDLSLAEQNAWKKAIREFISAAPVIVGHNLAFDWQFLFVHFGARMNRVVDTMLQEQIIYSVGLGASEMAGKPVNMQATGSRYGLNVSKDAQIWFVDLDKPRKFYANGQYYVEVLKKKALKKFWFNADGTACAEEQLPKPGEEPVRESSEQWYGEYPDHQLNYMEQDVIIPLQLQTAQAYKLQDLDMLPVAALENAALPAFAWLCACGCRVDKDRWAAILDKKKSQHRQLEEALGEMLTPYIQEDRKEKYDVKMAAHNAWIGSRDAATEQLTKEYAVLFTQGQTGGQSSAQYVRDNVAKIIGERVQKPDAKSRRELDEPINLGSHVQLKVVLSRIGIHVASTDKKVLGAYSTHEAVAMLLEWKALDKFITSFGDNILSMIDVDGRIHPTYTQIGARTGRTSCSKPNWQQLPSKEPDETSVRKCVIAEPSNVLLTCDLPNIELRILAEMSGDEKMLSIFAAGGDVHSLTAKLMFNLSDDCNPKKMELKPGITYRFVAKTINFGLTYGMGVDSLAATLNVTREEAIELVSIYKDTYKTAIAYLAELAKLGLDRGYSVTLLGRKRFYTKPARPIYNRMAYASYDEFYASDRWKDYKKESGYVSRESKNSPIQGTNAEIIKSAMLLLYYTLPVGCYMVASVHDELVIECNITIADKVKSIVQDCMYKACRQFLKVVAINKEKELDVVVAPYWKKE